MNYFMEVIEEYIASSIPLTKDYINNREKAAALFDYGTKEKDFLRRYQELSQRSFDRKALYHHLKKYNQNLYYSIGALDELNKLKRPETVFVVTGQQAGLLTGPVYTISKAITVIKEAKVREQQLGVPVIPLFWIAGEDHDLDEVNHVYLPGDQKPVKKTFKSRQLPQASVSDQPISNHDLKHWLKEVFALLPETEHTMNISNTIDMLASRSTTLTAFFAEMMRWIFRDSGLVMLDSHHPELRELEKDVFYAIIDDNYKVRKELKNGSIAREQAGYPLLGGIDLECAHFFFHENRQRSLMYERPIEKYMDKKGVFTYSKGRLLDAVRTKPSLFSANVLTRPLIQDSIIPVLSYIGGPGEINYWSVLKPLFHHFHMKMPPLLGRMEFTFVPRTAEAALQKERVEIQQIVTEGAASPLAKARRRGIQSDGNELAAAAINALRPHHQKLSEALRGTAPGEESFSENHWKRMVYELERFGNRINKHQENKNLASIKRIEKAAQFLRPFGQPQERIYCIIVFLNLYGSHFAAELLSQDITANNRHKTIIL
ncbi:bacillithiol biosynthesis cysteine-adding enzyme BshC [Alteribacillus sp. HJP-4]|uniref:bacillithiol biosynthesis cysteine-adding enzyme BshC n=1 Tax=Alteribacillus sp. HJP-4 TaxID=2775394 RepID=UPI0035CD3AA0